MDHDDLSTGGDSPGESSGPFRVGLAPPPDAVPNASRRRGRRPIVPVRPTGRLEAWYLERMDELPALRGRFVVDVSELLFPNAWERLTGLGFREAPEAAVNGERVLVLGGDSENDPRQTLRFHGDGRVEVCSRPDWWQAAEVIVASSTGDILERYFSAPAS
jgi:hypothetical protein